MNRYRIFETENFLKDLEDDFSHRKARILLKLREYAYPQLLENPFYGKNVKKLRHYIPPTWRYRIGDMRFFYTIDQDKKIIIMIAADNRKDAY